MEIKYLKCLSRLLYRNCVNKRVLDLSKEVLWVSLGKRAAKLSAVKVEGLKKDSTPLPGSNLLRPRRAKWRNFFYLQLWQPVGHSSAAL